MMTQPTERVNKP